MTVLIGLNWFFKIIFFTSAMVFLFILELLSIFYSDKKDVKETSEIIVSSSTENVENFILKNYYRLKNSRKCGNALLISLNADEEQEQICKYFSEFKNISYIKYNINF